MSEAVGREGVDYEFKTLIMAAHINGSFQKVTKLFVHHPPLTWDPDDYYILCEQQQTLLI